MNFTYYCLLAYQLLSWGMIIYDILTAPTDIEVWSEDIE